MKTVEFFTDQIIQQAKDLVKEDGKPKELLKREADAIRSRIEFFKDCRNYMLSQPKEEFIRSEIARLETFINAKALEFSDGVDTSLINVRAASALRKQHEDKYGIPKKRKQLKALRFILD